MQLEIRDEWIHLIRLDERTRGSQHWLNDMTWLCSSTLETNSKSGSLGGTGRVQNALEQDFYKLDCWKMDSLVLFAGR